ncbi:MAG: hypothetical protein NTU69_12300 [Proteobacteria bacterium]|nr:hypothetical protein [Pseudomonadota bacterium]
MQPESVKDLQTKLDRIEETVSRIRVSVAFYDELFILKEHIHMVRRQLFLVNHPLSEESDDGSHKKCT